MKKSTVRSIRIIRFFDALFLTHSPYVSLIMSSPHEARRESRFSYFVFAHPTPLPPFVVLCRRHHTTRPSAKSPAPARLLSPSFRRLVMEDFPRCRFLFVSRLRIIKRSGNMFRQVSYTYIRGIRGLERIENVIHQFPPASATESCGNDDCGAEKRNLYKQYNDITRTP